MIVLFEPQSCSGSLEINRNANRIIQSGKLQPKNKRLLFFKAFTILGSLLIFSLKEPVYSNRSSSLRAGSTVLSNDPNTLKTNGSVRLLRSGHLDNSSLIEKLNEVVFCFLASYILFSSTVL